MFSPQPGPFQPQNAASEFAYPDDILPMGGFSRGSSLPWHGHENVSATLGTGPIRHSFSNIVTSSIDATGQKPSSCSQLGAHAQPLQIYPRSCQWTPAGMHARFTPASTAHNVLPSQSNIKRQTALVSQSRSIDNPSSPMAVPLITDVIADDPIISPPSLPSSNAAAESSYSISPSVSRFSEPVAPGHVIGSVAREKKHGCWMCHKSFDRPSTLRKHLLVHTGEKAHVCKTCGRRFGVASNLNRHVKRCLLRPVHSATGASPTKSPEVANRDTSSVVNESPPEEASHIPDPTVSLRSHGVGTSDLPSESSVPTKRNSKSKRPRLDSSPCESPSSSNSSDPRRRRQPTPYSDAKQNRTPKRRRRAPSPSQWIPFSLLAFDLNPIEFHKSTMVPLPPVTPSAMEERNSWDENVGTAPYRDHWKGKLPGPGLAVGLGRKDVGNIADHNGYFMGTLSLF